MRYFRGYVKTGTGEAEEYDFEVADNATEADVDEAMQMAMWESGIVDTWYVEMEKQNG